MKTMPNTTSAMTSAAREEVVRVRVSVEGWRAGRKVPVGKISEEGYGNGGDRNKGVWIEIQTPCSYFAVPLSGA
jgi:hypothetical protein